MQQGPYHSPVIDIPSPAKLIAGTPVKQPHETEGRGKRWWELSLHCMCKWESESKKQTKEGDTFQQHGDKGWKNMRKERKSNLESEWKDYLTERERMKRKKSKKERESILSSVTLCDEFCSSPSAVSTPWCDNCWTAVLQHSWWNFIHCAHNCIPLQKHANKYFLRHSDR